jgi:hypothetical protein
MKLNREPIKNMSDETKKNPLEDLLGTWKGDD